MWFLFYLLALANFFSMLHLGMFMVGANMYDVLQLRKSAKIKGQLKKTAVRTEHPLVSVVIAAHNEALVIKRTLDSIRQSTYANYEIIVVDDGSTDKTGEIVRNYIQCLPKTKTVSVLAPQLGMLSRLPKTSVWRSQFNAREKEKHTYKRRYKRVALTDARIVLVSQTNKGKGAAINNGIRSEARGELVMTLDADSIIHPAAIERAVEYFADPKVIGVAANVRIMESKSILGAVQRFEHMIGYRSKKFYSLTNSEFIIGGVASTYRLSALKNVGLYDTDTVTEDIGLSLKLVAYAGNRNARLVYAADVLAMTEGVQAFRQLLRQRYRWKMGCLQNLFKYRELILNSDNAKYSGMLTMYRLPVALLGEVLLILQPFVLAYVLFLTVHFHTLNLILGSYLIITLYVLWTIWPDEHLTVREKLRMSRLAVVIYGLFYIMDVVQVVAIFRCLKSYRTVISRNTASTWVSPTRAGQADPA